MRLYEDLFDELGPIAQTPASQKVADDDDTGALLPNDDHFEFRLFFDAPKFKMLKSPKSIQQQIDRMTTLIQHTFDMSPQIVDYSQIRAVSADYKHKEMQGTLFHESLFGEERASGFEVGANIELGSPKGLVKLLTRLANVADVFSAPHDEADVRISKFGEDGQKRSKYIRPRDANRFHREKFDVNDYIHLTDKSMVSGFVETAYFMYGLPQTDLSLYRRIAKMTNDVIARASLDEAEKKTTGHWGTKDTIALPKSLEQKLLNNKADIINVERQREKKRQYPTIENDSECFVDVPASYNGTVSEIHTWEIWTSSPTVSGLTKLIYDKIKTEFNEPVSVRYFHMGVAKKEYKDNRVFFAMNLGPIAPNEHFMFEIVYLVYNEIKMGDFEETKRVVNKTLNHIAEIFHIEITDSERQVVTERIRAFVKVKSL